VNKYHNKPMQVGRIRFDSRAEARRYQELELLEKAGAIRDLRPHPTYVLQEGFKCNGAKIKPIIYIGDAEYFDTETNNRVCEDTKGGRATQTAVFKLKRKMFLFKYPDIELRIVEVA
jgi:hypothetical protein